jgi:hypothetical protein
VAQLHRSDSIIKNDIWDDKWAKDGGGRHSLIIIIFEKNFVLISVMSGLKNQFLNSSLPKILNFEFFNFLFQNFENFDFTKSQNLIFH